VIRLVSGERDPLQVFSRRLSWQPTALLMQTGIASDIFQGYACSMMAMPENAVQEIPEFTSSNTQIFFLA
jgi:hypothetical protein